MIVEQLRDQDSFSPIEQTIADHFLAAGEALRDQSARSIAAQLYTAPSTVSRFCKRLGYEGYPDFRDAYLDELRYLSSAFTDIDANQPFRRGDNTATIAAKIGALYRETVSDTLLLADMAALERATDLLCHASLAIVYSAGTQLHLAQDFSDKMARIGRRVMVPPSDEIPFYLGNRCSEDEVWLIMSYSGETPALVRTARRIHDNGGTIVAITSYGKNALSEIADVVLHVSTREKLVEKLGAYGMNISTMLLLDTLYSCVFARDYDRNAIGRARDGHEFEPYRDSSNPILHDRRD